jgi:hypothetical protein
VRLLALFAALAISSAPAACAPAASTAAQSSGQQIVLVQLKLSDDGLGASGETFKLYDVEDAVEAALAGKGVLDGHDIGGGFFTIYIYGTDSGAILKAIAPALRNPLVRKGSFVMAGPEEEPAKRRRIELPLRD